MPDRFSDCYPITAAWEGGWSDHPADPGGKTMYGITEATWHGYQDRMGQKRTPVRGITKAQALAFYRSEFWTAAGCDILFPGVDLAVFDASVNSGVSRGRAWLKAAVGSNDHSETVKRICRARLSFMQALKIWKTFGKGWSRRVADIEVKGVAMALASMGATASRIRKNAADEANAAQKAARTADAAAKTTGAGGVTVGTGSAVDAGGMDASALWVLSGVAAVAIVTAVVLYVKKRAHDARADAYSHAVTA